MSYARDSLSNTTQFTVAIVSVDPIAQVAEAWLRDGSSVTVHTDIQVGGIAVTPAIGEQWVIESGIGGWKLSHRLPFNEPAAQVERVEGQTRVGSGNGPVALVGPVKAYDPITLNTKSTGGRQSAADAGEGAMIYDKTLHKPIWSDGTQWRDAAGTVV